MCYIFWDICVIYFEIYVLYILRYMCYIFRDICVIYFEIYVLYILRYMCYIFWDICVIYFPRCYSHLFCNNFQVCFTVSFFLFFFLWCCTPSWATSSSFLRFLDLTWWHTKFGRPPRDKWSSHGRDLYLTTHNTHDRQTSMPPAGFEAAVLASRQLQTYSLDCEATGTDTSLHSPLKIIPSL